MPATKHKKHLTNKLFETKSSLVIARTACQQRMLCGIDQAVKAERDKTDI